MCAAWCLGFELHNGHVLGQGSGLGHEGLGGILCLLAFTVLHHVVPHAPCTVQHVSNALVQPALGVTSGHLPVLGRGEGGLTTPPPQPPHTNPRGAHTTAPMFCRVGLAQPQTWLRVGPRQCAGAPGLRSGSGWGVLTGRHPSHKSRPTLCLVLWQGVLWRGEGLAPGPGRGPIGTG